MLVWKTEKIQIECVVRGYLSGSGWKEYQKDKKENPEKYKPAGIDKELPEDYTTVEMELPEDVKKMRGINRNNLKKHYEKLDLHYNGLDEEIVIKEDFYTPEDPRINTKIYSQKEIDHVEIEKGNDRGI